jgi:hypothetical protein
MTAKSITIKAEKNYPKKEEKAFATLLPRPEKRKKETSHTKKTIKHGNSHI